MPSIRYKKKSMNLKYVAGVDIGGTTITIVLINTKGKIISEKQISTEAEKGPDYAVKNISNTIQELLENKNLTLKSLWRVGVGSPGPLNSKKGIIYNPVNLPGWNNVNLKNKLERKLKVKVGIDNDANCAVYGEKWIGAAKNAKNVVGITLGTGIGGGIIVEGRLVRGASYNAGEIGHTTINYDGIKCKCGSLGCFEQYASATAIANFAKEKIKKGKFSIITEMVKGDLNKITSKIVYEAMKQDDKLAIEVWDEFIKYLSAGVANIINFLNPEVVVIGGGVINAGKDLFLPLQVSVKERTFSETFNVAKIVPATLGQKAGAIGAAGLVIFEGDFYGLDK